MSAFRLAIALATASIACLPLSSAYAARTCSVGARHAIYVTAQDLAFKQRIIDATVRPGANIALFQALGSPLANYDNPFSSDLNLRLSYSALVDIDPIVWKLETLPGIQYASDGGAIVCPSVALPYTPFPVEVYELLNKRWGTYYYLTTDAEFRQLKRQVGQPDDAWEWTGESFFAEAIAVFGLCSGTAYSPVQRLEHTGPDGYVTHYYTVDLETCGYAKSELGMISRGQPFAGQAPRLDPAQPPCASNAAPLYRLYNNREREGRPNHRYTPNLALANQLVTQGWTNEGIGLCANP
jgi:Repeat of unknown function (DUF5648)